MSAELHRLSNGLSVAVDPLAGAESIALGLYAKVGSRSEPTPLSGLAHLVEHMVFKGAGARGTRSRRHVRALPPEQHQQDDDRDRHAQQPKQCTFSKSHRCLHGWVMQIRAAAVEQASPQRGSSQS